MDKNLIIGIHSIEHALKNPKRSGHHLVGTEEGINELKKKAQLSKDELAGIDIEMVSPHELQERGKHVFRDLDFEFKRIPNQIYLVTSALPSIDTNTLIQEMNKNSSIKILCLDQVTDVHNGAAIMRTAAFYGVNALVISQKGSFGSSPSFFRIASGATEYIPIVNVSKLPKFLKTVSDMGVKVVGFSEHALTTPDEIEGLKNHEKKCLVLGAEDKGLSNAVSRIIEIKVGLPTKGRIKSLNVSSAAAVAMEKFF